METDGGNRRSDTMANQRSVTNCMSPVQPMSETMVIKSEAVTVVSSSHAMAVA